MHWEFLRGEYSYRIYQTCPQDPLFTKQLCSHHLGRFCISGVVVGLGYTGRLLLLSSFSLSPCSAHARMYSRTSSLAHPWERRSHPHAVPLRKWLCPCRHLQASPLAFPWGLSHFKARVPHCHVLGGKGRPCGDVTPRIKQAGVPRRQMPHPQSRGSEVSLGARPVSFWSRGYFFPPPLSESRG